ncbi:O-antigen ligase family protein [Stutzerimonas stutzeri]|uniref:O-antigen ligase family protein n=1 Tax=Stutzerimonas stutzeri TaxID=316 RepID=UPI0002F5D588|nr:bifunctional O-antigen ligase/aminoglycoside phosphotransferase family protein [Stutzerimonas stutzeri]
MTRLFPSAHHLDDFIARRWLIVGYVALLTGLFWLGDTSAYTKLYYGLMAAPALIALIVRPRYWLIMLREPVILAFLALAAWLLLSLSWTSSEDDPSGLAKRPIYVFMMFASCTIIVLKDQRQLLRALRIAAMLASLAALVGLAMFLTGAEHDRMIGTGALSNPLLSSHVFGFFCTYWVAVWLTDRNCPSWFSIIFTIPLLAAVLATGSRTPLMAMALTSLWMVALAGRRALYLVAAVIITVISGVVLMPEILLQRGLSFRPELWNDAIRQASDHFWIGHGYGAEFGFDIAELGFILTDPHNVQLAVLLELGIVGLALWLLMYLLAFFRCLSQQHHASLQLASALVVYGLAAGLTEGSNFLSRPNENWFLIWIPLSLIAAISISLRQEAPRSRTLSRGQLNELLQTARVIEEDGHGVKVAELADGNYLKLFRRKRMVSSALWSPPSRRFAENAKQLQSLGVTVPSIDCFIRIPSARLEGIIYRPLPGDTLRNHWRNLGDTERDQDIRQFGAFLGQLHQLGIYFRSLHLGNVLKQPDGSLGLIDVADMIISQHALSSSKRRRNLTHMLRYREDSQWLTVQHISALTSGYADQCGQPAARKLEQRLRTIKNGAS